MEQKNQKFIDALKKICDATCEKYIQVSDTIYSIYFAGEIEKSIYLIGEKNNNFYTKLIITRFLTEKDALTINSVRRENDKITIKFTIRYPSGDSELTSTTLLTSLFSPENLLI